MAAQVVGTCWIVHTRWIAKKRKNGCAGSMRGETTADSDSSSTTQSYAAARSGLHQRLVSGHFMSRAQTTLFDSERQLLTDSLDITAQSLNAYGSAYDHWAMRRR